MGLITNANLNSITDKLAALYDRWLTEFGIDTGSATAGTDRFLVSQMLDVLVADSDNYDAQNDISGPVYTQLQKTNRKSVARQQLQSIALALNDHISNEGDTVDDTITDVNTYQSYYNGGGGGSAFSSLLHPVFGDLWFDLFASRITSSNLFHPAIHPTITSGTSANGMGLRAVGGSFTAGTAYDSTPLYAEVVPLLEVTVDFAGGATAPVVSVAGTDNTGATSTTWSVTLGSNNPTAAISTTITPACSAMQTQTVAVASATGIVVGSVLTINSGLVDAENVIVEAVSGSDLTFVCMKAHLAGAALTGKLTLALTPSVAGRRMRSVSGITITIGTHSAGTVRVVGKQDRQYLPGLS